jgi:ankyrin repeat protein
LHRASQNGHVDCIEELVKAGADINAEKNPVDLVAWGATPLLLATAHNEGPAVQKLLDLDAKLGLALHFVSLEGLDGEIAIAKALLKKYPDPNVYDPILGTPLQAAVLAESKDMVKLFLSTPGININATGPAGRTALIIAAMLENQLVETLIEAKVDVNIRDHEGKMALDHAIRNGNSKTTEILCAHTKLELSGEAGVRNHGPLYLATRMDSDSVFNTVNTACKKLKPTQYAELCELALHAAIASDEEDRFDKLLEVNGVEATVEDDDGWTPSYCAKCYNRSGMMEKLELKLGKYQESTGGPQSQTNNPAIKEPSAWHTTDRHPALYQPGEKNPTAAMVVSK